MTDETGTWHKCSMCKKEIAFHASYFACSVSTCNRKRNPLYFCSLGCWEAHLPMMRHRDAWAEQQHAPSRAEWEAGRAEREAAADADDDEPPVELALPRATPDLTRPEAPTGVRRIVREPEPPRASAPVRRREGAGPVVSAGPSEPEEYGGEGPVPEEVLVVVSKLKAYIRARSGMNTSEGVVGPLSRHLRRLCDEAIRNAGRDGRRTVLDRDIPPSR